MRRVIFLLVALVFTVSVQAQEKQKITLEDILVKGTFNAQTVDGLRPMKDGEHYTTLENKTQIVKYSFSTGKEVAVVFDITKIKDAPVKSFSNYEFSADETKILLTTAVQPIYRHSFTATYYVWNQVTEEFLPLSENKYESCSNTFRYSNNSLLVSFSEFEFFS